MQENNIKTTVEERRKRCEEEEEKAASKVPLLFRDVRESVQKNTYTSLKNAIDALECCIADWKRYRDALTAARKAESEEGEKSSLSRPPASGIRAPRQASYAEVSISTQTICLDKNKETENKQLAAPIVSKKQNNKNQERKEKKPSKVPSEPNFTVVTYKKKIKKKTVTPKGIPQTSRLPKKKLPPAVEIRSAPGKSNEETIRFLKAQVNPADLKIEVTKIRVTRNGKVLVEILEKDRDKTGELANALATALGEGSDAKALGSRTLLEIRSMDATVTGDEVTEAVMAKTLCKKEEVTVRRINQAHQGTKTALIEVPNDSAGKLLAAKHMKIGWNSCSICPNTEVTRCF